MVFKVISHLQVLLFFFLFCFVLLMITTSKIATTPFAPYFKDLCLVGILLVRV